MKARPSKLLRQWTIVQLVAVATGIFCLGLGYFLMTRDTYRNALKTERTKVLVSLAEQQEKWRTWKQVGLDAALRLDLASHAKVFSLAQLDVVPASQVRMPLSSEEMVIPASASPDAFVVYAKLDPEQIESAYVPYWSNFRLLAACGILFSVMVLLSARYVRRRIYYPLLELREVLEAVNAGKPVDTSSIKASGEIREFISAVTDLYARLKENEKNAAMVTIAKQVAHDIRSPLAALDMILDTLPQLPENKRRVIRGALGRIRDIANNILERSRRSLLETELQVANRDAAQLELPPQPLASLIDELVTEKQILVRSRPNVVLEAQFDASAYCVFARVEPQPFKTILSNLVNNSLEAIEDKGEIRIALERRGVEAWVTVADNGGGIPAEVLGQLRESGGSFGKAQGSGLGLSNARATVAAWGGRVEIESRPQLGTQIRLRLPIAPQPLWFAPGIEVEEDSYVVVVDDDPSIHLVWQHRFTEAMKTSGRGVFLEHFSDTQSLRRWCEAHFEDRANTLFLCDYEIAGSGENGLQLIQSLGIHKRAILVTGRFDEEEIRALCEEKGIRLLPKGLGGCVPVEIVERRATPSLAVDPVSTVARPNQREDNPQNLH